MDRRFGFKDLVLFLLLVALIVSVWLAMKQYDRQWAALRTIVERMDQQGGAQARMERQLGQLQQTLEAGVNVSRADGNPVASDATAPGDPFSRIRAAREMPDFAEGDWVIDAFSANVARITPLISSDYYASQIEARIVETLATRDPETLDWKPLLASSWNVQDNTDAWNAYVNARKAEPLTENEVTREPAYAALETDAQRADYITRRLAEGRREQDIVEEPDCPPAAVITFQLRRGVTFSDGEPLTANDVQHTYDLIMDERIDAPRTRNSIATKIRSAKATGPFEVVFQFKSPYFESFGLAGSLPVLPKHFYSRFTPQQINSIPGLILGSGPYRMRSPTDWAPGKPLELVRNERYWGVLPAFERLLYREITNDVARVTALKNGEIDLFFQALPEQYLAMTSDPQLMSRSQAFEADRPIDGYGYIAWNQRKGDSPTRFADKRVRQAMTLLTNRQEIVEKVLHGLGNIPTGPFNRLSKQYNHDIQPWPYDLPKAIALLKQAGFEDRNRDGVLESATGEPFIFTHIYPTQEGGQGFWDKVVLLMKDNYARAGIVMELDPLEWSVFSEKLKSRDFDSISLAWTAGIEGDIYQMFHSDNIGGGADNFMSYSNPQLDQLIDEARSTIDEDKRMPLWRQCHTIVHEDQPYTFLYVRKFLMVVDERYRNIEPIAIGINDREEWYVPLALQKY